MPKLKLNPCHHSCYMDGLWHPPIPASTLLHFKHPSSHYSCRAAAVRAIRSTATKTSDEFVLAIDVGTSGTKVALVSSLGTIAASAFAPHPAPITSVEGGKASLEQDEQTWWLATKLALKDCVTSASTIEHGIKLSFIKAIALTGQMQDIIFLPKDGATSKRKAIVYSDARAVQEADEIAKMVGGQAFLSSIIGGPQGATSLLAKLRWLDKYDCAAVHQCQNIVFGGHDYITWKLTQACVTDATTASTTGLVDCSFQYPKSLLRKLNLDHWIERFPLITPSDIPCGEVSKTAAAELGYTELQGIPVLHCCGDNGACSLGAGAGVPGILYAYLGTSGWVAGSFRREPIDTKEKLPLPGVFRLAHPDSSLVFKTGSIMTAGGNLAWAASNLNLDVQSSSVSMEVLDRLASSSPMGSGGLLYLPFLSGERCPFEDSDARAVFIGISASTSPSNMFRSVMEGVCFALRSARDAMENPQNSGLCPLHLVGGGARSPVWPSILANVFGQTVHVLEDAQDVGVKGAALLAGKWLGWHSNFSPGGDWVKVKETFDPSAIDIETYNELFAAYNEAYSSLRNTFKKLSIISKVKQ